MTLNRNNREVFFDGQILHLTRNEYATLELLMLRKGVVVTKDAFLNHLYGRMDGLEMKIIDVSSASYRRNSRGAGAVNLILTC